MHSFGQTAQKLSRNPLGIIGLFVFLVYGLATLVVIYRDSLSVALQWILVLFLTVFPILILAAFLFLVTRHSDKLYGPGDFTDEENYMRIRVAASLTAASVKPDEPTNESTLNRIVESVADLGTNLRKRRHNGTTVILWVDDQPENNAFERRAFEAIEYQFQIALSTDEALARLSNHHYDAIISDMERPEGPAEGHKLLRTLRDKGDHTPLIIYTSRVTVELMRNSQANGAQGCTNDPEELFRLVVDGVIGGQRKTKPT